MSDAYEYSGGFPTGRNVHCHVKMEARQETHLQRVKQRAAEIIDKKYRAGQAEHGGFLLDIGVDGLLDAAIDEAVDQVVYLLSLKEIIEGSRSEMK